MSTQELDAAGGWPPAAHTLEIACDPTKVLESVQLRATCSEGVLGLAGLTVLAADKPD